MEKVGLKQIIFGGAFLLIGIYMLFNPIGTFSFLTYIFGVIVILFGSNELITLIKTKQKIGFQKLFNYLAIIFGGVIMVIAREEWLDLIGLVIAFFFLITGVTRIVERYSHDEYSTVSIYGIGMTIFGIIMLFEPSLGVRFFTVLLSFSLIFAGLSQLMIGLVVRKFTSVNFSHDMSQFTEDNNKKTSKDTEKDIIDVEYRDVE